VLASGRVGQHTVDVEDDGRPVPEDPSRQRQFSLLSTDSIIESG